MPYEGWTNPYAVSCSSARTRSDAASAGPQGPRGTAATSLPTRFPPGACSLRAAGAAARAAEGVDFRDAERRPPERRVAARRILGADRGDAGVAAASGTLCRPRRADVVALAGRLRRRRGRGGRRRGARGGRGGGRWPGGGRGGRRGGGRGRRRRSGRGGGRWPGGGRGGRRGGGR